MTQQTYDNCDSTTTHNIDDEVLPIEENVDDKKNFIVQAYKFGLFPTENSKLKEIDEQLYFSNKLYNEYVEFENKTYRPLYREIPGKIDESIFNLENAISSKEEELEYVKDNIKKLHIINRNKKTPTEFKNLKSSIIKEIKKFTEELKEKRKLIKTDVVYNEKCAELKQQRYANMTLLYDKYKSKVFYDTIHFTKKNFLKALNASNKTIFKNMKYKTYNNSGNLGICNINSTLANLNTSNALLQIEAIDNDIYYLKRSDRKKLSRKLIKFKIKSENRKPVWAEFSCIFHRPLPKDAIIKYAQLQKTIHCNKVDYNLILTLNIPKSTQLVNNNSENKKLACAIDIGWRKINNQLRFATIIDTNGNICVENISAQIIDKFEHVKSLQSIQQKEFDKCKQSLIEFIEKNKNTINLPNWFVEKTKYLQQMKSRNKLYKFVKFWKNNRFENDEKIFNETMWKWKKTENHLNNWKVNEMRKVIIHRDECYKILAKKLFDNYNYVILEDFDLTKVAKIPDIDKNENDNETARSNRQIVAPSCFRQAIALKFHKDNIITINPSNTSKMCNKCKTIENIGQDLTHICSYCGERYDRDENASKNILELGLKKITQ